ncbi:PTS sugar transporter subunit IIA [Paenibacillus sp. TAB 01]|uniref:PTS sugar transporter subunit IIA n=1 Tax=Paenibacillus sp. TAB 01 TaxID=3368988 RepID=UPI003752DB43
MTLDRSSKLRPEPPLEAQAWQRLLQLKAYMDEIVSLIGQFQVFELPAVQASGKDSATVLRLTLQRICETINIEGTISQTEQVVQKLLEREKHGTQVIPDTRLALFHTRSEAIRKPMLSTFRLSEPLILDPEEPAGVTQIVLMLGPLELSKESLEVT